MSKTVPKTQNNSQPLTLSQKINQLDRSIEWFYSEDFTLEQATEKYKNATKQAKSVISDLENLKNEIEILSTDFSK